VGRPPPRAQTCRNPAAPPGPPPSGSNRMKGGGGGEGLEYQAELDAQEVIQIRSHDNILQNVG